jgi:hypothetical protein
MKSKGLTEKAENKQENAEWEYVEDEDIEKEKVDESLISKRKYMRGKRRTRVWVWVRLCVGLDQ